MLPATRRWPRRRRWRARSARGSAGPLVEAGLLVRRVEVEERDPQATGREAWAAPPDLGRCEALEPQQAALSQRTHAHQHGVEQLDLFARGGAPTAAKLVWPAVMGRPPRPASSRPR